MTGFWPREHDGDRTWRWMGPTRPGRSSRPTPRPRVTLDVDLQRVPRRTSARGAARRRRANRRSSSTRVARTYRIGPLTLTAGAHQLTFHSTAPPTVADDVLGNGDRRAVVVCDRHVELVGANEHLTARAYRRFWAGVGERFPDLGGAASTRYYADNEQRLFTEHLPPLAGLRVLKTDLWDEAKNTRILAWAAHRGARAFGIDISEPTVMQARAAFTRDSGPLRAAAADVRALPFRDASFDAIYSMGTIEHFDETEQAVKEMARVLKPGGRAIIGVPNRHDPFLRPLLATVAPGGRTLRIRLREVLFASRAEADARTRRVQRGRRDGDPVHSRAAADARPRVPLVVPARCRGDRRARVAVRLARSARRRRPKTRLPAGDRRGQTGAFLILISDFHIVAVLYGPC